MYPPSGRETNALPSPAAFGGLPAKQGLAPFFGVFPAHGAYLRGSILGKNHPQECLKNHEPNPETYLRFVLERIAEQASNRLDELLPWNYARDERLAA